MTTLSDLIDAEARDAFPGRFTHLDIRHWPTRTGLRCVAILEDQTTRETLALGYGSDHGRACTMILAALQDRDYELDSAETASVLGITADAVRQRVKRGTLRPVHRPGQGGALAFAPAEVGRGLAAKLVRNSP